MLKDSVEHETLGKPDYALLQECDEICKFYVNERDHSNAWCLIRTVRMTVS